MEKYDPRTNALLERCSSRRFTMYWTLKSTLADTASRLIDHRRARTISIGSADDFFAHLLEKIDALDSLASHPLSAKTAAETVKRYLVDPTRRIDLNDLVVRETERVYSHLTDDQFPVKVHLAEQEFQQRLKRYEALTEVLRAVTATGCYWGDKHHYADLWVRAIERITNFKTQHHGSNGWYDLRRYPALLLLYAAGIGAASVHDWAAISTSGFLQKNGPENGHWRFTSSVITSISRHSKRSKARAYLSSSGSRSRKFSRRTSNR